jgi:hypothetical protein
MQELHMLKLKINLSALANRFIISQISLKPPAVVFNCHSKAPCEHRQLL